MDCLLVRLGRASPKRESKLHHGQDTCFLQAFFCTFLQCDHRVLRDGCKAVASGRAGKVEGAVSPLGLVSMTTVRLAPPSTGLLRLAEVGSDRSAVGPRCVVLYIQLFGFGCASATCSCLLRREVASGLGQSWQTAASRKWPVCGAGGSPLREFLEQQRFSPQK